MNDEKNPQNLNLQKDEKNKVNEKDEKDEKNQQNQNENFSLLPIQIKQNNVLMNAIPLELSGEIGNNRAKSRAQISAKDDQSAVLAWLARYQDSPATLSNYRKEAERLLLWCVHQRAIALSSLTHEDLLLYQRFLADPQPRERWIMQTKQKPSRDSPDWRPFAGALSPSSQRQAMSILNALFSWLVQAGYLLGNPLSLARRKKRSTKRQTQRFLPQAHWDEVKKTILEMPKETPKTKAQAARCRWLFSLLYLGGLRVSEICVGSMSHFYSRKDRFGIERWWLEVLGKGQKTRDIPISEEFLDELRRYRREQQLSDLPQYGENQALVMSLIGDNKPLARSAIHEIVKNVMRNTAKRLREQNPNLEEVAMQIEAASTHWLRHTAGTHMADLGLDIQTVRDNLGHANLSTTSIYIHSEDDARHDASKEHKIKWDD